MESQQRIFFDFLRFCIGAVTEIPASVSGADWKVQYAIAKKQALLGVMFYGIKQLPKELAPDADLLMRWMGLAQNIRQQNIRLFMDSAKVSSNFKRDGFRNCILKGQGNALLYPDPYMRNPGDIDIYLEGGRKRIMQYVNKLCPNQVMRYHHIDFPVMKTSIEVHFTPSFMSNPLYNRRIQKWFGEVMELQCSNVVTLPDGYGEIAVPTARFNVVYILAHLYRHVFTEGVGLRQLIDYYFVLNNLQLSEPRTRAADYSNLDNADSSANSDCADSQVNDLARLSSNKLSSRDSSLSERKAVECKETSFDGQCESQYENKFSDLRQENPERSVHCPLADEVNCKSFAEGEINAEAERVYRDEFKRELKLLGLWKFAGAVMWVLHEVLGLSEDKMIAPMDEKEGRFLLDEIMQGGNFGQYDTRLGNKADESKLHRYFRMNLRNLRLVKHYPAEALCEPLFRTWFAVWKKLHGIK